MQFLLTDITDNILTITINRPDKMNALNIQLIQELGQVMDDAVTNDDIHGIILTGAGEKAFAAGADIAEFANFSVEEGTAMSRAGHAIFNKFENAPKPTIAAVNGFSLGGGCELAMACHMRIAAEHARFGQPEVNLGVIPGYGATQRLIQLVGKGKAMELLLTADMIKAPEALALGLVNHVVPQAELISKCREILKKTATKGPDAIAKSIACANAYFQDGVDGFEVEINAFGSCFTTEEFKEGTSAFVEKRKANFKTASLTEA